MGSFFLLGMGNIGKRYLQSLRLLDASLTIHIFDKNLSSEEIDKQAIEIIGKEKHSISSYNNLEDFIQNIDNKSIISMATYADSRIDLTKSILKKKPRLLILEKPLCQNSSDLNELLGLEKIATTDIRCNLSSHYQPYFYKLKSRLNEASSIEIDILDTQSGIACVGVHYFDLLAWLSKDHNLSLDHFDFKSLYESKRKGFQDIKGTIQVSTKNSKLIFSNIGEELEEKIKIRFDKEEVEFDFLKDKDHLGHLEVSQYYHKIILFGLGKTSHCPLPTIREASPSHIVLYDALKDAGLEELNYT